MATIVTRSGKSAPLTHDEADDNFTNLNTELALKLENVVEDLSPQLGSNLDAQSSYKIINLTDPTADQDSATKAYVDTQVATKIASVSDDTEPSLSADFDQNGNMIKDDSRNYQILGDDSSPASTFDSFNSTARVHGVVKTANVVGPTNRVHSHPSLTKVTATADSTNLSNRNAGRLRFNYMDSQYLLESFDNTTTGFGQGFNSCFVSSFSKNNDTGNGVSTLAQQTAITATTQFKADSSPGAGITALNVQDCRVINMEPNINSTNGKIVIDNMYGLYYNSVNDDTGPSSKGSEYTNEYSFYGNVANASMYNAGGMQLPVVTIANLSTLPQREGNTAYVTNESTVTSGKCLVFYDGTNWKLAHSPDTTASE